MSHWARMNEESERKERIRLKEEDAAYMIRADIMGIYKAWNAVGNVAGLRENNLE